MRDIYRDYIYVFCPHSHSKRKVPVAFFNEMCYVTNTCDFSNGCCPCTQCLTQIQQLLNTDRSIVHKSHDLPLELLLDS